MKPVITTDDFFSLSSFLNYQLSGIPINWRAVLELVQPDSQEQVNEELIIEAMMYLWEAYGQEKRVLGPFAVIHPIRTASLLSRAGPATTLDLLTTLLHDKNEEITRNKYSRETWEGLESRYEALIRKVDSIENWFLNERIHFLTREQDETYTEYLYSLINQARATPELIKVKLADRLDNTLDLRMDLYEDLPSTDCYQIIFEALFTDSYRGPAIKRHYHTDRKINGAGRLYQLFKNCLFLSLLRSDGTKLDKTGQQLFDSLAITSINESQNILLHIFAYHLTDPGMHKVVLMEVMDYCSRGGIKRISPEGEHRLDGLFKGYFDYENKVQLRKRLTDLYNDKTLMAEAAVAFSAIFTNFLNDPSYWIEGISGEGIRSGTAQES